MQLAPVYRKTYLSQLKTEFKIWLFLIALLALCRAAFILSLSNQVAADSGLAEFIETAFNGFRFDSKYVTIWLLPLFIFSALNSFWNMDRAQHVLRMTWSGLFILSVIFLTGVSIGYYQEYRDIFNHHLFGLIYDDTRAVMITLVKEYHLLPKLAAIALLSGFFTWLLTRWVRFNTDTAISPPPSRLVTRLIVMFMVMFLILGAGRGSFDRRPMQEKDAATTTDAFLNKAVLVPHAALYYAIQWNREVQTSAGLERYLPDQDIRKAVKDYFATEQEYGTLDSYFMTSAHGPKSVPPRHIFIIAMESYHSWPLREKYRSLQLSDGVRSLGQDGVMVMNYLPASTSTMRSLQSLITGLPSGLLRVPHESTSQTVYPTAIAGIFRRLGYRTRFFYGGYLSWQQVGSFTRRQGFDEVYGGAHMDQEGGGNEWGVDDRRLFSFIEQVVTDDLPSLNVILSTTNHPPYDIDLVGEGFPLSQFPDSVLQDADPELEQDEYLRQLGHFWYADREVERFSRRFEKQHPDSLFAITGDHYGRDHLMARPPLYDRSSVPLVLYGRQVLSGISLPAKMAGSHVDLIPTLVELVAPEGFQYQRMGRDMLDAGIEQFGFGEGRVITAEFVADNHGNVQMLNDGDGMDRQKQDWLLQRERQYQAIGWWRVRKGNQLPSGTEIDNMLASQGN